MHPVFVVLLIACGLWLAFVGVLALAGRRGLAKNLALFLPNVVLLIRGLSRDRRVPRSTRLLLLAGLVWLVSPIDLIPEFIPVVGALDDAIVAALILRRVVRVAGREVVAEHWRGDGGSLRMLLRAAGVSP